NLNGEALRTMVRNGFRADSIFLPSDQGHTAHSDTRELPCSCPASLPRTGIQDGCCKGQHLYVTCMTSLPGNSACLLRMRGSMEGQVVWVSRDHELSSPHTRHLCCSARQENNV